MVVGHTRCLMDGCFGLKYRRSDCDIRPQLQSVVEDSASVNSAQLYQAPEFTQPAFQWYDWVAFLDKQFKSLYGIRSLQHFRFSKHWPGSVFVKETATVEEREITLFILPTLRFANFISSNNQGQWSHIGKETMSFTSIHEHVWDPYKDVICLHPNLNCLHLCCITLA